MKYLSVLVLAAATLSAQKASLEGVVLNSVTNQPLRKAVITLNTSNKPPRAAISGSDGRFEFLNIEPGDFSLNASAAGFGQIWITPGNEKVVIKLVPHGVVTGRLVDEEGDPVRGASVIAMGIRYTPLGREVSGWLNDRTDDRGEFRIVDVPPGKYYLRADPPQTGPSSDRYVPAYYPSVPDVVGGTPILLAPGQELSGLNFSFRKAAFVKIRGTLIAPEGGAKLEAGQMTARAHGMLSGGGSTPASDGKFELAVAPGVVYLYGKWELGNKRASTLFPITVGTADIEGIELRPLPPINVAGRVRIAGGGAIPPAIWVHLRGSDNRVFPLDSNTFFREVTPDRYRLTVDRMEPFYLRSIRLGMIDMTESVIDLLGGTPPDGEILIELGSDFGEVEGSLSEGVGMVTLIPEGHLKHHFKSVRTDAAGRFRVVGLAPGRYRAIAWESVDVDQVQYDPDFLKAYPSAGKIIEVEPNGRLTIRLGVER